MVDAYLGRKYKLESSENLDQYMKAIGVGLVTRKVGNAVSPVVELNKDGDEYVLTLNSAFVNIVTRFKPGVEFGHKTPDGRKLKSIITVEGNTLKEVQKGDNGKVTTIYRTWTDDVIETFLKVGDITATRVYKIQTENALIQEVS